MKRYVFAACAAFVALSAHAAETVWLDEMDLSTLECGWGTPRKNRSVDGNVLRPGGKGFKRGVGTHAVSSYVVIADGKALAFDATVGLDAEAGSLEGSVKFVVNADGRK